MATLDPSTYKTGNPIGSNKAEDLRDNARCLDVFSTSSADSYLDRFGNKRPTISKIEKNANDAFSSANGIDKGTYSVGKKYENYNDYFTYNNAGTLQQWSVKTPSQGGPSLDYEITEANPINDSNLTLRGDASQSYVDSKIRENTTMRFNTVALLLSSQFDFVTGDKVETYEFNAPVKSTWTIVDSGAGDMTDATLLLANGKYAKLNVTASVVNVLEFGATGKEGDDQTEALQKALTFGQTLNASKQFIYYLPGMGIYEATNLSVDRSLVSRRIVIAGDIPTNIDRGAVLKFTDTTKSSGFEWDSTMMAYNVCFDFNDARSVGTLADPRWTIDIRNTDGADDTADIDAQFIDCWMKNFHRGIKLFGRGFLWEGGSIVSGGGAVSEGCFLDLDFPNPLVPGSTPDQTEVTGMRSYRIQGTRIHACTGYLLRNKGYNANNLAQFDFNNLFSDTYMGLVRGAACNINVNGGTWLSCPTTFIRIDAGFDMRNVSLNGPNLLGMPEENIGQQTSNGPVTEQQVLDNAQGLILYVDPAAGNVENFTQTGGIVSDTKADLFQIQKAINGFSFTGVVTNNLCKENKESGGSVRKVFNFFNTNSTAIVITNNAFKALPGAEVKTPVFDGPNCVTFELEDNMLVGNMFETFNRPKDTNFGGEFGSTFCGKYTGDGTSNRRVYVLSNRYAKSVTVANRDTGETWMSIDGDGTGTVRLAGGELYVNGDANNNGVAYSFMFNF